MVNSLRGMYDRLSYISGLLTADRADALGSSPNLLPIHYHLSELETFRNETLAQAKRGGAGAGANKTLEAYFERLGETIVQFELHYFALARELIALAKKGNASVAVKVAKIAEVEGARDQKAIAIRMVKKSANIDVAARFRSLQAEARTIKHYRAKVMDAIRESCKLAIERNHEQFGDDGVGWLENLDWIYEDLTVVEEELVQHFPQDWKVRCFVLCGVRSADFAGSPDPHRLVRLRAPHAALETEADLPLSTARKGTTRQCTTTSQRGSRPGRTRARCSVSRSTRRSTRRR